MADIAAPASPNASTASGERMSLGAFSWALYEWARNPYVIVCNIYVFAPYVATVVIGDPVEGQARLADLGKWAGIVTACVAPFVGAWADRAGRRKIPLAAVTFTMAALIGLLWFVQPGAGLDAALWFPLLLTIGLLFPLTEALHNAMLPAATTPRLLPQVSGLGLALGNLGGVLILAFVLWFLAFPGAVDWPGVPDAPVFGLDRATHEPERFVTILCALWLAVFTLPMLLTTADSARGEPWGQAFVSGARRVVATLRGLRDLGPVGRFLLARMLYADAKTAIIVLGGVYVAGVMGWGLLEMTLYGILMSIVAVAGGLLGGWLDHAIGAKRAVILEIGATTIGLLGLVSIDRDTVLFAIEVGDAPVWGVPFFDTASELVVLGFVSLLAAFITAAYASSRTLMTQLAPPERAGELFGLYALAGTATVWLGPLVVGVATRATESQQLGFGALIVLLLAGLAVMVGVRAPARPAP